MTILLNGCDKSNFNQRTESLTSFLLYHQKLYHKMKKIIVYINHSPIYTKHQRILALIDITPKCQSQITILCQTHMSVSGSKCIFSDLLVLLFYINSE